MSIDWDLEAAIEQIIVSPYCPKTYLPVVQRAISYLSPALASLVVASEIGTVPVY